jgi:hypothetical protein
MPSAPWYGLYEEEGIDGLASNGQLGFRNHLLTSPVSFTVAANTN